MNINYKQPQFELFPANSATFDDTSKPPFLLASMTLSLENLVILLVLGIMIGLFSYSLGVERGRHLVAQALDDKVAAAWNVGGRRLVVVPNAPEAVKAPAVKPTVVTKSVATKTPPIATTKINSSSKWTVQVATYTNENYAQQEALGLKAKGYPVFIIKSKEYFLVCIGQYGSLSQTEVFLKKMQPKHSGSQIRRF